MSKKRILWTLFALGFFAFNFVSVDKAKDDYTEQANAAYSEFFQDKFDRSFYFYTTDADLRIISTEMFEVLKISDLEGTVPWRIPNTKVTATVYTPFHPMNNLTASGKEIDTKNASAHRWIAVSRDLQEAGFDFGSKVQISGTKTHDGIWEVQDVMNARWKKRIDFLSEKDTRHGKWRNVTITKIN